jgi:hypothetical protein
MCSPGGEKPTEEHAPQHPAAASGKTSFATYAEFFSGHRIEKCTNRIVERMPHETDWKVGPTGGQRAAADAMPPLPWGASKKHDVSRVPFPVLDYRQDRLGGADMNRSALPLRRRDAGLCEQSEELKH